MQNSTQPQKLCNEKTITSKIFNIYSLDDFYFKSTRYFSKEYQNGEIPEDIMLNHLYSAKRYYDFTNNDSGKFFVLKHIYACEVYKAFNNKDINALEEIVPKIKNLITESESSDKFQPSYSKLLATVFYYKALLLKLNKNLAQAHQNLILSKTILEQLSLKFPDYYKAKGLLGFVIGLLLEVSNDIESAFE